MWSMANAAKRRKIQQNIGPSGETTVLEKEDSKNVDCKLRTFLKWCKNSRFDVNQKVKVGRQGSCHNYGMVAVDDITEGETLFTVPREALLHPGNCSISALLKQGESELRSGSGWVPLLLCLMNEYTKADSKWKPYFNICPDYTQLDPPMFWDREMITNELQGTVIPDLVERDGENVHDEYHTVAVPFMKENPRHFDLNVHTLELYRKMVAFVMAYSFTEPKKSSRGPRGDAGDDDDDDEDDEDDSGGETSPPMMVPMADILNHVAKNNARLQFGKTSLSMVATRNIKKNDEVFNTYGELANWHLLQMYGFAEPYPQNIYDTVDLPVTLLRDQSESLDGDSAFTRVKWDFIKERVEVFDDTIVIGRDGILNEWETYHTLKVLSMTPAEFEKHQAYIACDDDDEMEEEHEDIEDNLEEFFSFDGLAELPTRWRKLLNNAASEHLKSYKNTLEEDLKLLKDSGTADSREKYVLHVRIGQRKLLEKMVTVRGPTVE